MSALADTALTAVLGLVLGIVVGLVLGIGIAVWDQNRRYRP
ncbi:MAG: hypothetical protein ACT4PO_15425 [Actinomycetota bacterium]